MATYLVWKDNVISMVRGDTLKIKLTIVKDEQQGLVGYINKNIEASKIYQLQEGDKVYFGLMAPNHTFEQSAIIKYIEQGEEPVKEPIVPQGTLDVTTNGEVNVYEYASVNINVPQPEGTCEITENGEYEVFNGTSGYSTVNVNVTPPPAIPLYTVNLTTQADEDGAYIKLFGTTDDDQGNSYISGLILLPNGPAPIPKSASNSSPKYFADSLYINPFLDDMQLTCRIVEDEYINLTSNKVLEVSGDVSVDSENIAHIYGNCNINITNTDFTQGDNIK